MAGLNPIAYLLYIVIDLYFYVVFAWIIMSVLISFNVINRHQPLVSRIFEALEQLVEPALRPIRKHLPAVGGFDIAPVVLFIGLQFLQYCILYFAR